MTEFRVIVHAENPGPLATQLGIRHRDVLVETCDGYETLPGLISKFRPDAVFTIRFAGTPGFPAAALLEADGPEWIHVGGSGTDHLGPWNPSSKTVTNSAGVAAGMMAEYALGAFLHFNLDVPGLAQDKENRVWRSRSMTPLEGRTVLIIGLGNTGIAVASRASSLGMKVIGVRTNVRDTKNVDEVFPPSALADVASRADHVVVCVPLTGETRNLIGKEFFAHLKPGAILVDLSRGGIVEETALLAALDDGTLRGAALDVFETEPLPVEHPLWTVDNVLISPHCSSVFDGWESASMEMFCDNLDRWRSGSTLVNIVDPGKGY